MCNRRLSVGICMAVAPYRFVSMYSRICSSSRWRGVSCRVFFVLLMMLLLPVALLPSVEFLRRRKGTCPESAFLLLVMANLSAIWVVLSLLDLHRAEGGVGDFAKNRRGLKVFSGDLDGLSVRGRKDRDGEGFLTGFDI